MIFHVSIERDYGFHLKKCVPSTLRAVTQYTEVLTVKLDLTPDILK